MVPLPSPEAKVQMMRKHLEDRAVADIPYDEVRLWSTTSIITGIVDSWADGGLQWSRLRVG